MGKYKRFALCPCCHKGGVIDLDVLGMCLFCWMKKREGGWVEEKTGSKKERLFKKSGNNRLCIIRIMHEAWCSRVGESTISQSISEGGSVCTG